MWEYGELEGEGVGMVGWKATVHGRMGNWRGEWGRGYWEGCVVEGGGVCGGGAAAPKGGRDARAGSNIIHLLNGRGGGILYHI
jgi:hypothetical protein